MSQRLTQSTTTGMRTIEILRGETPKSFEDAQALLPEKRNEEQEPESEAMPDDALRRVSD